MSPATRAWLTLLALSAATTGLAVSQSALSGWMINVCCAALLMFAWLKARVILSRYLGLAAAPDWLRGANLVLALYAALLLSLTLIA